MNDLLKCPYCATLIVPSADNRCPACDEVIERAAGVKSAGQNVLPIPISNRRGPSPESQQADFQASLHSSTPRVWVTPVLIAVNAVVFVAMLAASWSLSPTPATVLAWGANFGPKTLNGDAWRLVTAMFLHFNILHIGLNMWALFNLGRLMERLVGNLGFLLMYLISGLLGSLASVAWNPEVMSAGASGAVFGIGGALLGFVLLRRDTIPTVVLVPLRNSMFTFIGYNVVFGFLAPGIDNAAHLGGLAAGFGCGLLLSHPLTREGVSRRWLRNAILLVAGATTAAGVFWLLPEPPADLQTELQRLSDVEERFNSRYMELARRYESGKLRNTEFAREIENGLLPELTAIRSRFESLRPSPARRKVSGQIIAYLQLREKALRSLVLGLRNNDQAAVNQSLEQSAAANRLAKEISEGR